MDGKFMAKSSDVIHTGKSKRCRIVAQQNLKGFSSSVCPLHHWTSGMQPSGMVQRLCASVSLPLNQGQ